MIRKIVLAILILAVTSLASAEVQVEDDIPALSVVVEGEGQVYNIFIENTGEETVNVQNIVFGNLDEVVNIEPNTVVNPGETRRLNVSIAPGNATDQFYTGTISLQSEGASIENVPMAVRVTTKDQIGVRLNIDSTSERFEPGSDIGTLTVLTGDSEEQAVNMTYELRDAYTGKLVQNVSRHVTFQNATSFRQNIESENNFPIGDYYVQASAESERGTITSTATLSVHDPFWTATKYRIALGLIVSGIIIGGGVYTRRWYQQNKQDEARYVFPVDYSKLPNGEDLFEMGKVAETEQDAYIDPDDLTTHAIVSGSTGSGKSVTANVVAEEALEQDIPVVVFDPTAQWTGFVKELKDDNLIEHYERFDMDDEQDPHPYRGVIKEIDSKEPEIDFDELRNPGEITVFTLNQLTTEEFDQAVRVIIDQIFEKEWEESPTLELLIVFDEVHRLLEEYGGEGGYEALEKGAREFRKWGIGIMMCSQVTADFKQAISGNIMTEIQMQTKSMEDIKRVEKKYGEQFSKRISSEDVGVGMIQNSNYNDGDPWFVDFRPTYHNPHKIPDKELEKYHNLSKELDQLKDSLDELEDSQDKELELDLAENKLKEGRFKMAKMYIDSLKDEMDIS